MIAHDTRRGSRVALWDLEIRTHNHGNEWWLFTACGRPIESWSTEGRARWYLSEQNQFRSSYGMPDAVLWRLLPGIGFVRQQS